jgi:hypothetical protein
VELKQNPFSVYDFLGYFTPGALLLYSMLALVGHAQSGALEAYDFTNSLVIERGELYVPFILVAYTLGHLVSFLSAVTVEKYSVWAHGYPSAYLMDIGAKGFFATQHHKVARVVYRTLVALILLPVSLLDTILGRAFNMRELYTQPLPPELISLITTRTSKLVMAHGDKHDPVPSNMANKYFRMVYHYAVENCPNHFPKMQNYVALFGFLRTLTLLSSLLFWVLVWHVFMRPMPWHESFALVAGSALVSFCFYMAFVKFYRRFSLEALMAVVVTPEPGVPL